MKRNIDERNKTRSYTNTATTNSEFDLNWMFYWSNCVRSPPPEEELSALLSGYSFRICHLSKAQTGITYT